MCDISHDTSHDFSHPFLQAFIDEVESWKPKMKKVQESGEKLATDFPSDDAGRIKQVMENLSQRWTNVCSRLERFLFDT